MKIAFLGDISLNDEYVQLYQEGARPFDEIGAYLKSFDYVIGNLECLAQGDEGENELKRPRLKTTVETFNYLSDIGVNVVELAHNHVYDNLQDGFNKTIAFLDSKNIQHLGASIDASQANQPLIIEKEDISICLLNYVSRDTNPNLPEDADVYVNWLEENRIISEIKQYKQKYNYVILLLHWGGRMEGGNFPDWNQPKIAKSFIDAGADLIIGNHSHTIQPYEIYKRKYIYYSLGNFCFSKYIFFEDKKIIQPKYFQKGLLVQVDVDFNELILNNFIIKNKNHHIKLSKAKVYFLFLEVLYKIIFSSYFSWKIYVAIHNIFSVFCLYIRVLFTGQYTLEEKVSIFIKRVKRKIE